MTGKKKLDNGALNYLLENVSNSPRLRVLQPDRKVVNGEKHAN